MDGDVETERRAAAATVLIGLLFSQGTHVIGAAAYTLGMMTATSASGVISAMVAGAVASWVASAGVIVVALRRAREPRARPSTNVAVLSVAVAVVGMLGSTLLSTVTGSLMTSRMNHWTDAAGSLGDAIARVTMANVAANTLGFFVQLLVSIFAIAWLLGKSSPRDPG